MLKKNTTQVLSTVLIAATVVSCSKTSSLSDKLTSQVQNEFTERRSKQVRYPDSALIYNVCHERWLRNGYASYTFNVEEGVYQPGREIQQGRFSQMVVSNHRVSQSASCLLNYSPSGAGCVQSTRKRSTQGYTIDGLFAEWEDNPTLYQSCHPVLGYPTGYGHTYGSKERRIDANEWFLVSSVLPIGSSHVVTAGAAMTRVSGQSRPQSKHSRKSKKAHHSSRDSRDSRGKNQKLDRNKIAPGDFASVSELEIKLISSSVKKVSGRHSLISKFKVSNPTGLPALLGIKGWILDRSYNRYPLSTDGKKLKKGDDSEIVTIEVGAHTQMTVSYQADGVSNIRLGKQTVGMLEVMSVDGVKINLTLPNQ